MGTILNRMSRTNWYLGVLLALYLIAVPTRVQADGRDEQQVRTAVETWVRHVTADARPDAVVERMEPHKVGGEIVAYIVHLKGGGFCIAGADALVLPVYFYSPQGKYDPADPNYQYILWEIGERLKNLQRAKETRDPELQMYEEALLERAAFWQDLIAGRVPEKAEGLDAILAEPTSMRLQLTSRWNQTPPYNDQCPLLPPDEHAVVGCVATAMAQIMYYWEWPNTGVGTDSVNYNWRSRTNWDEEPLATNPGIPLNWRGGGRLEWTWSAADGGRLRMNGNWDESLYEDARSISNNSNYRNALQALWGRLTQQTTQPSVNFGATAYNWDILQDRHNVPRDAGDAEVAKLSYHAGVAVGMNYGVLWSGADLLDVDDALEDHFRYDRDGTDGARNVDTMTEEIQWLRPVVLGGCRPAPNDNECHAWIAFGYNRSTDPNRQFLMNLGWGGNSDGWYTLDSVSRLGFSSQDQVTRIAPLNVKFVGDDNPGDGSPNDPYEDIEEAISKAPNGATTLIFKAGSVNTFSTGTLTINRPLTLKGEDVTIRK